MTRIRSCNGWAIKTLPELSRVGKKKRKKKVRVPFRKNRESRTRDNKLTREIQERGLEQDERAFSERMSGKGELTRHRTVIGVEGEESDGLIRDIDESECRSGKVIAAVGLNSLVQSDDGTRYECTTRRVVRTLARDARNAVVTGDRVLFRPLDDEQGVIERVEPRFGTVSRWSHGREHVIVANVERAVIIASADEPPLKRNLIDRFLVSAEHGGVRPIICINKIDLVDPATLQPLVGEYARIGYDVVLTSAEPAKPWTISAWRNHRTIAESGLARLKRLIQGRETVFTGQSGVGKSSLLNALQPNLQLDTGAVSAWTQKGRHTTRRAILVELDFGGWVVDTPGIRQFRLWDVAPEEVEGYFVDFRPYVSLCKFPDCTHTHETGCGVKAAVEREEISASRYESYLRILDDEGE
ncbi:MAG: ribosome small subunit-dependent GTPase A [Planctomycetaceae bacterium]